MHHLFFMAFFMKQLPLTNLVRRLAMVTVLSSKFGIKYALGAVIGFVSLCNHVAGFAVVKFRLNELSPYFGTIHSKLIILIKSYTFSLSLSLSLSLYIYIYKHVCISSIQKFWSHIWCTTIRTTHKISVFFFFF